jgi:hypothetical protein
MSRIPNTAAHHLGRGALDAASLVAVRLEEMLPGLALIHLGQPGRGGVHPAARSAAHVHALQHTQHSNKEVRKRKKDLSKDKGSRGKDLMSYFLSHKFYF